MIELRNLTIGYDRPLAEGLNLTLEKGQIIALLGANGCGKTTLLKTLLGLISALGGEILLENRPHFDFSPAMLAQTLAYVPQAHQSHVAFSVKEMVLMGRTAYLSWFAQPTKQDVAIAEQALDALGITQLSQKSFMQLSGGERQLVLIARALAQQTPYIIMDEPTSNLDFGNQLRVLEQIQQLRQQGLTVLFTTHQPEQAYRYAEQVLLFHQGEMIAQGRPQEVMTLADLAQIYRLPEAVIAKNLSLTLKEKR